MTFAFAGTGVLMPVIFPLSKIMEAFGTTLPVAVCKVAPVIATGTVCFGAGAGLCAETIPEIQSVKESMVNIDFFMFLIGINGSGTHVLRLPEYRSGRERAVSFQHFGCCLFRHLQRRAFSG